MRLLIITQKVDKNDPILGFFHRWLEEFSKHCESLIVICLSKGEYNLPKNIKVLSLGKENGKSRIKYLWNFYKYLWQERKSYGKVFVHMNQEYIILGGLLWRILGKKTFLWRNHLKGDFLTRLAVLLSNRVFCTSHQSFTARFKKTKLMPVGIDTNFFRPDSSVQKKPHSILFLGRIAPVKNVDIFIEALNELQKLGAQFTATVAGSVLLIYTEYEEIIQGKVAKYRLSDKVRFVGSITQNEALKLYQEHEFYVNLTLPGSMDKTIFEAMACNVVPLVYNQDLKEILGEKLVVSKLNSFDIAERIKDILLRRVSKDFRDFIVENHSLYRLVSRLMAEINP